MIFFNYFVQRISLILVIINIFTFAQLYKPFSIIEASKGPIYECKESGHVCTFENIILSETNYEWQPYTKNRDNIDNVHFVNCTIPVLTGNICKYFSSLREINIRGQYVREIKHNAFYDCQVLARVHLEDNQIEKIEKYTFSTSNIFRIHLDGNRIRVLDCSLANLANLTELSVRNNNLTEFSPELIRNNHNLEILRLSSNELPDIHVEQIIQVRPTLRELNFDDNEISCVRTVEIINILKRKGIQTGDKFKQKSRYYQQRKVSDGYTCNGDIEWMASNHRKDNDVKKNNLMTLLKQEGTIHGRVSETNQNINNLYDTLMKHINEQYEMIRKLRPECLKNDNRTRSFYDY